MVTLTANETIKISNKVDVSGNTTSLETLVYTVPANSYAEVQIQMTVPGGGFNNVGNFLFIDGVKVLQTDNSAGVRYHERGVQNVFTSNAFTPVGGDLIYYGKHVLGPGSTIGVSRGSFSQDGTYKIWGATFINTP